MSNATEAVSNALTSGFQMGVGLDDRRRRLQNEAEDRKREKIEFDTRQREARLRLDSAQRVADAQATVVGMETKGVLDPSKFDPSDMHVPVYRPPTKRELLNARRGLAAATGNLTAMRELDGEERGLRVDERDAEYQKRADDPEFVNEILSLTNLKSKRLTVAEGKDGIKTLTVVQDDGKARRLDLNTRQFRQLMRGAAQLAEQDYDNGLRTIASIDKELADVIAQDNELLGRVTDNNNDAVYKRAGMANDAARTRIAGEGLQLQRRGNPIIMQNEAGQPVLVYPELLPQQGGQATLPPGLRMPPREGRDNTAEVLRAATAMVGQPTGRRNDNNQPEKYTLETAMAEVRRSLGMNTGQASPGAAPVSQEAYQNRLQTGKNVNTDNRNPVAGLPLANPTLAQLRAMSDEALAMYNANPLARAVIRERAAEREGPVQAYGLTPPY